MGRSQYTFYGECVNDWIADRDASVLVVGAGRNDAGVFRGLGWRNVTLTDLDGRVFEGAGEYAVEKQDVEDLSYADGSFDYAVAHAMLHHCRSPHRALLEMYRVARRGVLAIEARDSLTIRTARRLGHSSLYETGAVRSHEGRSGGVANTHVPNHIYRWTETEFRKAIRSYSPEMRHRFRFRYGIKFAPLLRAQDRPGLVGKAAVLGNLALRAATALTPGQRNLFAMFVEKPSGPEGLQPWLRERDGELEFNMEWSGQD